MRINDLITESFSDARMVFSRDATPDDVIKYIDRFKQLSSKNIIKGEDKDIGTWVSAGWEDFRNFIDQYQSAVTKSTSKKQAKKDRILVHEDDMVRVVIPLTKEASCFYGKNTKWCTTSNDSDNHWDRYFYHNVDTMFYILPKNDDPKYSVLLQADDPSRQIVYNDQDEVIAYEKMTELYGITKDMVIDWYEGFRNKIMAARDLNNLDEHIQARILTEFPEFASNLSNPNEDMLASVASQNARIVNHLEKPSERVLLAAVGRNVRILHDIENPSEAIQLKAIERNPLAYTLLKNPTAKATELYNQLKD